MIHFVVPSEARWRVRKATAGTIRRLPLDLAKRIACALSEPPNEHDQSVGENAALSCMLWQEEKHKFRIETLALRLLRTVVYRSLREERLHWERLGLPKVTLEALHDALMYAAGFIAGEARSDRRHYQANKKKLDKGKQLSYTPEHDESVRNCDVQDE